MNERSRWKRGSMSEQTRCVNCGAPIHVTNYALGPEWEHYDPRAGFPTRHKGTAWRNCKTSVATPPAAAGGGSE